MLEVFFTENKTKQDYLIKLRQFHHIVWFSLLCFC
jgi:hypothetical protein